LTAEEDKIMTRSDLKLYYWDDLGLENAPNHPTRAFALAISKEHAVDLIVEDLQEQLDAEGISEEIVGERVAELREVLVLKRSHHHHRAAGFVLRDAVKPPRPDPLETSPWHVPDFGWGEEAQRALVKMLVASVRRRRFPGTKMDWMLVLRGKQGCGKTTFLRALFGEQRVVELFRLVHPVDGRRAAERIQGFDCVEICEDNFRTIDESTKSFLFSDLDRYRPPYGRTEKIVHRVCVFVGTTSQSDFAENRRFWVVDVPEKIDVEWVRKNREAIWAAAEKLEAAGAPHGRDA
jgi:predicted P-loop ATPase